MKKESEDGNPRALFGECDFTVCLLCGCVCSTKQEVEITEGIDFKAPYGTQSSGYICSNCLSAALKKLSVEDIEHLRNAYLPDDTQYRTKQ